MDMGSIDTLILCGGKGKRLKSIVNDKPKILADIGGSPFIKYLLDYLESEGIKRVVLCTGYMHNQIDEWVRSAYHGKMQIILSNEKMPLGTAGAIKSVEKIINSDPFIVINGDTLINLKLKIFLNFHQQKNAIASIATTRIGIKKTSGTVIIDSNYCITDFIEKSILKKTKKSFINAGIYIFKKNILAHIPTGLKQSLEYELFPFILKKYKHRIFGFTAEVKLLDIGTPKNLNKAITFLGLPHNKVILK